MVFPKEGILKTDFLGEFRPHFNPFYPFKYQCQSIFQRATCLRDQLADEEIVYAGNIVNQAGKLTFYADRAPFSAGKMVFLKEGILKTYLLGEFQPHFNPFYPIIYQLRGLFQNTTSVSDQFAGEVLVYAGRIVNQADKLNFYADREFVLAGRQ